MLGVQARTVTALATRRSSDEASCSAWRGSRPNSGAIPDVCTNVSLGERLRVVSRHNPKSVIVLPRPYVAEAPDRAGCRMGRADQRRQPRIQCRLAPLVSGNRAAPSPGTSPTADRHRRAHLSAVRRRRRSRPSSGVRFLASSTTLEALRARCRMTLVPDLAGTGIAVKTLTALAASHPVVSTDVGPRRLDLTRSRAASCRPTRTATRSHPTCLRCCAIRPCSRARRAASRAADQGRSSAAGATQTRWPTRRAPDRGHAGETAAGGARSRVADSGGRARPARPSPTRDTDREFTFRAGGSASALLSAGWHRGEVWGRRMDGATSRLSFAGTRSIRRA